MGAGMLDAGVNKGAGGDEQGSVNHHRGGGYVPGVEQGCQTGLYR